MAFPTIVFDSTTGSDAAASGAGPATAISGSAASYTGSVVSLDGSPDLSGVAVDGSAVLYLATSAGRAFFAITAADNVAKTVTVASAPAGTASGLSWAIGGKRQTIDGARSRLLFTADAKPGWTIQCDGQSLTSTITLTTAVGGTSGLITLRGTSRTSRSVLTQTANTSHFDGSMYYWKFQDLKFANSNASKTAASAISLDAGGSVFPVYFQDCTFGDATNTLLHGIFRASAASPALVVRDCEVGWCTGYGLDSGGGGTAQPSIEGCYVHDNGAVAGINVALSGWGTVPIRGCIVAGNAGAGILFAANSSNQGIPDVSGNTIHGNTSDGIQVNAALNFAGATIVDNQITANGGYGINYTGSNGDALKGYVDFNNFGTGATANTSGAVNGFTNGADGTLAADPGYADAAGGDYSLGSGSTSRGAGFPGGSRTVGADGSATATHRDVGASQHADSGGGGAGVSRSRIYTGA